ncbi:hypothetical protein [Mesorhizobium sp. IMUNJ 23232]|uniref:hypothetical protein n=1 Tax=Mesorhizobium sp. IMUNJ 23232 TaxID=3376064 RepID=UPI0037BAE505
MPRPKLGKSDSERLQMVITKEELEAIDAWRYQNRVPSKSEAIRRLCALALFQEQAKPEITERMKSLLDSVTLMADETLVERPRDPDEIEELRHLGRQLFIDFYNLYDKIVEVTLKSGAMSDGETSFEEQMTWAKKVSDFLNGRSLFETFRESPEAMERIAQAADAKRREKGGEK